MQPDNEIWSVNRIKHEKYSKIHAESGVGRLVPNLFLFFRKALYDVKASGQQLSFNIFRELSTWCTMKTNCMNF